jgi:hypothetical protein
MGQWFKSGKAARRNEGAGRLVVTEKDFSNLDGS